ncbi:MAG TPA: alpha/beta hydrolase fold domain-containing protein [Solirubrobacteraceae bacterium]|nr:alpha/beta hydrolase fold domain-containing protein [Solirubrobacteraceae bacterium]
MPDSVRPGSPPLVYLHGGGWTIGSIDTDDLRGRPPALVITVEHDPLGDEAERCAARLAVAGVPTTLRHELGVVHNPLLLAASRSPAPLPSRAADDVRAPLARDRVARRWGRG